MLTSTATLLTSLTTQVSLKLTMPRSRARTSCGTSLREATSSTSHARDVARKALKTWARPTRLMQTQWASHQLTPRKEAKVKVRMHITGRWNWSLGSKAQGEALSSTQHCRVSKTSWSLMRSQSLICQGPRKGRNESSLLSGISTWRLTMLQISGVRMDDPRSACLATVRLEPASKVVSVRITT